MNADVSNWSRYIIFLISGCISCRNSIVITMKIRLWKLVNICTFWSFLRPFSLLHWYHMYFCLYVSCMFVSHVFGVLKNTSLYLCVYMYVSEYDNMQTVLSIELRFGEHIRDYCCENCLIFLQILQQDLYLSHFKTTIQSFCD